MYQLSINNLTIEQFLSQYWQKKPLLIKSGFANFVDPIEPEELAGLAMEESIESRLITNHNNDWQAHHGPFENFSLLTEQNSTLLVQAVDHWHPKAATLLTPFRFVPNWRIDDLMISFSTPGGGVGPHLDQYDVFIIQGKGKRHWRVGMPDPNLKQFAQNKSLLQVEQFDAIIDAVLESGDILYIPPGCPHEGYAVENALNYSVGFRAPDQKDLISSFADYLIDNELGNTRYSDANLIKSDSVGMISDNEVENIHQLMQQAFADKHTFKHWLGTMISQPKHDMDLAPLDEPLNYEELTDYLASSDFIYRAGGVRSVYQVHDKSVLLSVNAQTYTLPITALSSVQLLTDKTEFTVLQIKEALKCVVFMKTLAKLISEGTYYLQEGDEFE
ncbi:50S ribosomal protein L16 3-hydroxylase [Pseudoalteromonas sp. CIP111854]|uniref:50S ribosomal protein L16 3-hydroxylase n=1 Tax=Pseudoalteromonas holothuriae TaxID=2963714 RepID=A0A9W4VX13_9GAMM|nr:cupin domain-containing protein [Pseudoalteromonas sp. CIP111854]CAH9060936.1 50S ribosomal protein L16 3-hydroxylase [Pseudoalteromonas sp. CIP111854]